MMNLYSVRDVNVGFNQPFADKNDEVATRGFAYAVNNSDIMGFAPKDFDLYLLGSFDEKTGEIKPVFPSILVVKGTDIYERKET